MGMLFDERKLSYHLMLQYFQKSGALKAFFESFNWALSIQEGESSSSKHTNADLRGNLDPLCETWLMLLERLVNVRNIMETPHTIVDKPSANKNTSPAVAFDPVAFLLETHKAALGTLKRLWSGEKLHALSARTCDSVLVTLCYLIHGEKLIKRKLLKQTSETPPQETASASSVRLLNAASEAMAADPTLEPQNFQQLVDMGFSRGSVMEALLHTQTLEAATEWILSHPQPSEEDELMRAISMSLQTTSSDESKKEEKPDAEPKKAEEQPGPSMEQPEEPDRYLSGQEIDCFIDGLLDGCLELLDNFPDSVYRVYEVYEAVMKRNGSDWTKEKRVFETVLQEISKSCDRLLHTCHTMHAVDQSDLFSSSNEADKKKLSSRCILLSLLFQGRQFTDLCADALNHSQVISRLVELLAAGSTCLCRARTTAPTTPDWISSVTLLIDLYERSCMHKRRVDALSHYRTMPRMWKWFDDRSGRWCNYSSSNQKILDDAYQEGASKIEFSAGRRRYKVNFLQMVQMNEESGNRRPIMVTFTKDKKATGGDSAMDSNGAAEETKMDTDSVAGKGVDGARWNGITSEQARSLLHSCTTLLKIPVNADALHAIMRLLLRLTRSDSPGGHGRAVQFVKLEGPQALLQLTKQNEFAGFASLATLIFCHIFEDDETLKHAMEKTARVAALRGIPNQWSGVSASTIGNREMYYVLQALAPMACRHPSTFVEVCKANLRICMPSSKSSHVAEEEARMKNGTAVQILEPTKNPDSRSHHRPLLIPTMKHVLQLLLNSLICSNGTKVGALETSTKEHSKSASSLSSFGEQLRQLGDDMNRRYSEGEASLRRDRAEALRQCSVNVPPVAAMEEGTVPAGQEMEEVFACTDDALETEDKRDLESLKEKPPKPKRQLLSTPLFSKAAILRLLAELVSSYPACAGFIVYHTYPASLSPLILQDCSCLSFILHHLLPPTSDPAASKKQEGDAASSKNNQDDKDCCSSLARVLLTSVVCCHPKPSVQSTVVSEIKACLHKTLLLPESQSKHNALRALLALISNMMECASKMVSTSYGGAGHPGLDDPLSLARVMINKGLATDLAQIPNCIDLGSPNMAESINAALKPLEILSRLVHHPSAPSTLRPSCGSGKTGETEEEEEEEGASAGLSTQPGEESSQSMMEHSEERTESEQHTDEGAISSSGGMYERGTETSFDSVIGENNESMNDTFIVTDSDLMMSESTDHDDVVEEDDEDEDDVVDMNVEDDHVDDDDDQDSSGSEDQTEHNNDDQDLDDDGSEMDDMDDDDDEDPNLARGVSYETFMYDMLNEMTTTTENSILLQLENVLNDRFGGRLPAPLANARTSQIVGMPFPVGDDTTNAIAGMSSSLFIPTTHPMLTRTARPASSNATAAAPPTGVRSRSMHSSNVTANRSGQTLQIEFTSSSQEAPHILTRLIGPAATSDVLQLTNSLYNEGVGHAQLLVNSNNIHVLQSNQDMGNAGLSDNIGSMGGGRAGTGTLSILPTALTRWAQTCEVLEPDSTQYCLLGLRQEIIDCLEEQRDRDIEQRRAKRALEKEKEEQKAKAAKERAEHGVVKTIKEETPEDATMAPVPTAAPESTPIAEDDQEEAQMDSGAAGISTPTNTPIATRPESPADEQTATRTVEVDAIDALQQASSSLQSVSLESNHEDEDVTSEPPESEDVAMQQGDATEQEVSEGVMDQIQDVPPDDTTSEQAVEEVEGGDSTETTTSETQSTTAAAGSSEFEGVDPSFLAALPDDIRQEVIREQLSRQGQHRANAPENQESGVSAEFLAALPPSIQQEVLNQERAEQARAAQQETSANDPVDPTVFIQTLPSSLRQSVLADMDDSLVAVLPADLAAEAQELRANMERRQQHYFPERLFSRSPHSSIMHRGVNLPSRFRPPGTGNSMWSNWCGTGMGKTPPRRGRQNLKVQVSQLLNQESLACMLLLLFVEEPKLNLTRLQRVLRNLCFHLPTRYWLVSTLLAILQRSAQVRHPTEQDGGGSDEAMEYRTTPTELLKQKRNLKHHNVPVTFVSDHRNTSWLSIRLDAALGSRASIFQVVKRSSQSGSGGARKKDPARRSLADSRIFIHPQAAPVVCRHTIDALSMLAKFFPTHFVNTTLRPGSVGQPLNKYEPLQSEFWDVLLRLDAMSFSPEQQKKVPEDKKILEGTEHDIESTCMGELLRMLAHPVLQRSQQLTDKLLRLLAQISLHLPTNPKTGVLQSQPAPDKADQGADKDQDKKDNGDSSPEDGSGTATMSARACTSNTSTVGYSTMNTNTETTGSNQSHGSISISAVSHDCLCATPLEKELELAVNILTSHACSEDGLEDATTLLFHLSKTQPILRPIIIKLLLQGAQQIGHKLCEQIMTLSEEMTQYVQQDSNQEMKAMSGSSSQQPSTSSTLVASSRYDPTQIFGLSGKAKLKPTGKELQLPIMQVLTSKTSNQAFFLRILKVIIQLQKVKKNDKKSESEGRRMAGAQGRHWSRMFTTSAIRNALVQITQTGQDMESDILDIAGASNVDEGNASSSAAKDDKEEKAPEDSEDNTSLCEKLQLEALWETLGTCLKQLEESNDPHAVLVLQPTVEAFFLVHATKQASAKPQDSQKEAESQLAHLDLQPLSPSLSTETASQPSQSSMAADDAVNSEAKKFLEFADTHRSILNQILRQSNVPLTEGPFSVLVNHTKVLDFDVKRQHFRQELERLEENSISRRDDIAIRVRRQHVFEDSFRELHRRSPEELKSRLYIVFEGEEGQDAGGLLREWYLIISKEIFNPMYALFRTSPGDRVTYTINPASYINSNHLSYFKFVGGIVAKAIYDNKLLDCYFTRSFYKHILGKPVKYQDMETEDYSFSQGLVFLLENDISMFGNELNFSVEIMEYGKTETRDLKPNGRNILVTEESKKEYAHLVCQEKMTGAIRQQLSAFLEGFYEIIPKRLISIFDEQELELLISGLPTVDIEDLRNNTEYHKYETSSLQIQWFWRALKSFDQAERAKFLQFVTGTSKVPLQGFAHLEGMTGAQKFQIHRDSRSTSRLPSAHTCFNQLDLPAYETYDKLRHMLLLAINECQEGFGLA